MHWFFGKMPICGRVELCVGSEWNEWDPAVCVVCFVSSEILEIVPTDYLKTNVEFEQFCF